MQPQAKSRLSKPLRPIFPTPPKQVEYNEPAAERQNTLVETLDTLLSQGCLSSPDPESLGLQTHSDKADNELLKFAKSKIKHLVRECDDLDTEERAHTQRVKESVTIVNLCNDLCACLTSSTMPRLMIHWWPTQTTSFTTYQRPAPQIPLLLLDIHAALHLQRCLEEGVYRKLHLSYTYFE